MKQFFLILICSLAFELTYAGNNIQWQKFINDTSVKALPNNWLVQAYTTDSKRNIYLSSISNGGDTTVSIISKYSPNGELLWKTSILPITNDFRYRTNFDWYGKMYVDIDSNIVVIVAGYDTMGFVQNSNYKRFILLTKFSSTGQILGSKMDYIPNYSSSIEHLGDIDIQPNGDIIVSHDGHQTNLPYVDIFVNKYNKYFDSLYTYRTKTNIDENIDAPIAIATRDSILNLAYTTSTPNVMNHWYLVQINTNSGDTIWQQSIHNNDYHNYPIQLEIMNNALYMVSYHITKLSLTNGSILNENAPNFSSINCLFDSTLNTIFSIDHNTKDVDVFDGNSLNVINTISLPYWPRDIVKQDTIITVIGIIADSLDQASNNQVGIFRMNNNLNFIDAFYYEYIKPIYATTLSGIWKPEIMADNQNAIVVFNEVNSKAFYNNLGQISATAPIFLQKICFNCKEDIKGRVYIDTNQNCINDSSDIIVERNLIHLMPEDVYTSTDSDGYYYFFKSSGIATIEYIPAFVGSVNCNNLNSYTVNTANGYQDSLDFGLIFKNGFYNDIAIKIFSGVARPGFIQFVCLDVSNLSNQKIYNPNVILNIDSNFSFVSSNIPIDSISGQQVYWNIDKLNVLSTKYIQVNLMVNGQLGESYLHKSNAFIINDIDTSNNHDTTSGIIIGSYDPNYIVVEPIGLTKKHFIENATNLEYYIEFQNTGTDTAFNIKILNEIDEDLDLASFKFYGSTHPVKYLIEGRTLKFYFEDILLVDSNKDYQQSIGHLTYGIKPKLCSDGTIISNNAAIYFDYNAPVITNTVFNTIGKPGSIFDLNNIDDFNIFPNPSYINNLHLVVNLVSGLHYKIQISDYVGRNIEFEDKNIFLNGKYYHSIQLSENQPEGLYLISLITNKNVVVKKWLYTNL